MKNTKNMKKKITKDSIENYTDEELGKILAMETLNITQMWMDTNKGKVFDSQYWLMLHLGFVAGLKVAGKSDVDVDVILATVQKELSIFDEEHEPLDELDEE